MERSIYTIEDLAANESFQQYCTGRNLRDVDYWKAYFEKYPEQRPTAEAAKKLYLALSGNHRAEQYEKHLHLFLSKIPAHDLRVAHRSAHPKILQRKLWYAAAACIVLMGVFMLLFRNQYFQKGIFAADPAGISFSSKAGEKKTFTLKDGTVITLNGATTITLDPEFNVKNRKLSLKGEAYFTVKHDEKMPFQVETSLLAIKDLGTIFNVRAFPEDPFTETTVIEGSVEVSALTQPEKQVILKPSYKLKFRNAVPQAAAAVSPGRIDTTSFIVTELKINTGAKTFMETEWVQNRLAFNDESFAVIALKLERWYNVKIEFENERVKAYKFVGTFENQSLQEVLDILQISRHFNYRKEGMRMIIY